MNSLKITRLRFHNIQLKGRDAHKLRGYFASKFPENTRLHNHDSQQGFVYRYPLVQYKVIDALPTAIGIQAGADDLTQLFLGMHELIIEDRVFPLHEKEIRTTYEELGYCASPITYQFLTPWLGLNQKNFLIYRNADAQARQVLLQRILVGNLLSLAKSLDLRLAPDQRIVVDQVHLLSESVTYKDRDMLAFRGSFRANFRVPALLGLGKSPARGFGTLAPFRGEVTS